ncbi:hypothetical protein F383_21851 [Gossypium arboreum]|uniref:Uncharacterized protein n=1 Tax=Gossypium arboreum TaxID=29729 RepID=A0A0B0NX55_GOSAR|nr:hypothetical protein F383_21851 [Gossypium arboreum]
MWLSLYAHGLVTRACLVAMWLSLYVCPILPRPRHTGLSNAV